MGFDATPIPCSPQQLRSDHSPPHVGSTTSFDFCHPVSGGPCHPLGGGCLWVHMVQQLLDDNAPLSEDSNINGQPPNVAMRCGGGSLLCGMLRFFSSGKPRQPQYLLEFFAATGRPDFLLSWPLRRLISRRRNHHDILFRAWWQTPAARGHLSRVGATDVTHANTHTERDTNTTYLNRSLARQPRTPSSPCFGWWEATV